MFKKIKDILNNYISDIKIAVVDDKSRRDIMFLWLNIILTIIASFMSLVNLLTAEYLLMASTLTFSALCLLNVVLTKTKIPKKLIFFVFGVEAIALLAFFLISGIPDGFSVLWITLIPSFSLLIFGKREGRTFCITALLLVTFLFWTPLGKSILMYDYSDTFMLRFPFLYVATNVISLLVEYVRSATKQQLEITEKEYRYLYRHDALTGLYSRYGFNEFIDSAFNNPTPKGVSLMVIDIDNFKIVNDKYGHNAGDEVLKRIANVLISELCEHCQYCRWGGEEFTIFVQCSHDPLEIAERLRSTIENTVVTYDGKDISVTVSIGVCVASDMTKTNISDMINRADKCMYKSKENGKNLVTSCNI